MLLSFAFVPTILFAQKDTLNGNIQQRDLIDIINRDMHINTNKVLGHVRKRKIYYSFLPTGTSVPGGGTALVTSTTAGFYLGDRVNTSLSTVTFSPYITLKGKYGYTFRSNLWSKENKWDVLGDMRFLYYPQYTWGLGGDTKESVKLLVNYKYIRFYQTFLRKIKPYFLAGIGYHFDGHFDIDAGDNDFLGLEKFTGYPYGTSSTERSFSSGLSFNLLYDARRNSINPIPGFYGNIVYRFNPVFLGSNRNWQSLYIDTRRYISFSRKQQNMLAFWAFYWTALNKQVPYLDLPSIGWDPYQQRSGRGFDQNRYRGKGLIYFETEYRRNITHNGLLGFVLFTNMNSVAQPVTNSYSYFHIAGGGGFRIRFNKRSGTNIAIDYGISRTYSGISLNLGETF
jgi:outer membrane protein assembly factor BamA